MPMLQRQESDSLKILQLSYLCDRQDNDALIVHFKKM